MTTVLFEIKEKIAYLTLNRPEKRNALSGQMVDELQTLLDEHRENEEVKILVIKAKGSVFCAGADLAYLKQLQENTFSENLADSEKLKKLFYTIYTYPKIVIAQVQGDAIAGGCGLATVCDFVFSVPRARYGYTEVRIGFVPAIVKVFLLRKIGEGRAKELLLSGGLISAEKAKDFGLINFLTSAEQLAKQVNSFALRLIRQNSPTSTRLTKQMIAEIQDMPLQDALDYAAEQNAKARSTPDCQKGIDAFLHKKPVEW